MRLRVRLRVVFKSAFKGNRLRVVFKGSRLSGRVAGPKNCKHVFLDI